MIIMIMIPMTRVSSPPRFPLLPVKQHQDKYYHHHHHYQPEDSTVVWCGVWMKFLILKYGTE